MKSRRPNLLFKAFADETRLRILCLLARGELCVCDIEKTLNLPQSKVSRHLAYLKTAGLVHDRKEGFWRHYSLAEPVGKLHRGLVDCLHGCFDEVEIVKRDASRVEKKRKAPIC